MSKWLLFEDHKRVGSNFYSSLYTLKKKKPRQNVIIWIYMQPSSSHLCRQHETTVTPIEKCYLWISITTPLQLITECKLFLSLPPLNGGGTSSHSC